jgi:3-dehydrosphinganine reductase
VARLLARRGSHVWILARDPNRLEHALRQLEGERAAPDQRLDALQADVADPKQVFAALEHLQSVYGPPHLVVNSAGIARPGYVQDIDLDIFYRQMEVNYYGCLHTTKAVLPGMLARGSGHIVFISSLGGLISAFGYTAYSASKFALHGFSDALRQEMKPHGIRVSIVCPVDTDTPQLAYENQYKPEETRALASNTGLASPEEVAAQILSGVARGSYLIIPSFEGKAFYWLKRVLGAGFDLGMDFLIARSRRNHPSS